MAIGQSIAGGLAYKNNKDAQKQTAAASRDLTRRMETSALAYKEQRPYAAEDRMNALRAQLGLLSPLNSLTSQITGGPQLDLNAAAQNPLTGHQTAVQTPALAAAGKLPTRRGDVVWPTAPKPSAIDQLGKKK